MCSRADFISPGPTYPFYSRGGGGVFIRVVSFLFEVEALLNVQKCRKTQKEFLWPEKSAKFNTIVSSNANVTGWESGPILNLALNTATYAGASLFG